MGGVSSNPRGVFTVFLIFILISSPGFVVAHPAATFIVDTDSDLPDVDLEDSQCLTSEGTCSLRAAIDQMNHDATGGEIAFADNYTISLNYPLDIKADDVTITGEGLDVTLNGMSLLVSSIFMLEGNDALIEYLTLTNPTRVGIYVGSSTLLAGSNHIEHDTFIDVGRAIFIQGSSDHNRGNNTLIQDNRIGTTEAYPITCIVSEQVSIGVQVGDYVQNTSIINNQIVCGLDTGVFMGSIDGAILSGNTIAGNANIGVEIFQSNNVSIAGNFIGNQGGMIGFPNGNFGIHIEYWPSHISIGGDTLVERNIISGNYPGCAIGMYLASDITIDGNLIGLDTAFNPLPNGLGINIENSQNITIGSDDHQLIQQFISTNYYGIITTYSDSISIKDDTLIGVANVSDDPAGDLPAGNYYYGIILGEKSTHVNVDSWKIAYNGSQGITAYPGDEPSQHTGNNRLLPKNIYGNELLAIDLRNDGHTPNDPGDLDIGPNDLLNYPEITNSSWHELTGTVCPYCQVVFYQAVGDPIADGGGGISIPEMTPATADSSGVWHAQLPSRLWGKPITLITYDPSTNQTSEFSPAITSYPIFLPCINKL